MLKIKCGIILDFENEKESISDLDINWIVNNTKGSQVPDVCRLVCKKNKTHKLLT